MTLRLTLGLLCQWALWECVAFGVFLVLCNRWLILLADGLLKVGIIAITGLAITSGASVLALSESPNIQRLPALLLLGFALGEVRRGWLRHNYRARSRIRALLPRVNLSRPVTTMDLLVCNYRVPTRLSLPRMRILHLTDLHFSSKLPAAYFERLHAVVREQAPDVILLGGDFISKKENLSLMNVWLDNLPKARFQTFAVLGNHDYWCRADEAVRVELVKRGIRWIAGDCEVLAKAGDRHLVLCGTEEPWGPGVRLHDVKPDDYVIALSHTPDSVYRTANRVDLMFAGHNHGGQLRIPWLGAIVVPSRFGRRLDRGVFRIGRTQLFVSSGIGVDAPYLRLYCPPEIIVVDLE